MGMAAKDRAVIVVKCISEVALWGFVKAVDGHFQADVTRSSDSLVFKGLMMRME